MSFAQQNKLFGLANHWAGRKLTQAEADRVVARHARFLKRERDGQRALLASADISNLEFTGRLLNDADFSGTNLSYAILKRSQLERCALSCANLEYCDASFSNLKSADLRGASLRGADFSHAVLDDADFRAAAMFRISRDDSQPAVAPLPRGNTGGVDFTNCSLKGASLNQVTLKGAIFRNALLDRASFSGARISDVVLDGAVLTNIVSGDLPFPKETLRNCILDPSPEALAKADEVRDKLNAHEEWALSGGKKGRPANFDGYDLRPMRFLFKKRQLTALSARNAVAVGIDFSESQVQGAQFEGTDFRDADFSLADLRGCNFSGAKLAHARFVKTDIRALSLVNGSVRRPNFSEADFDEAQLAAALRE